MSDREEPLPGGNLGGATRVGDTVRRPTGAWSPAVHALLRHLDTVGFASSPRVLGIDDGGREILTYLEGETVGDAARWPPWTRSEGSLAEVGALLRRYHEAVASFVPPSGAAWRFTDRSPGAGEVICHNDCAPYNVVHDGGRIVGLIDWDVAGPGHPWQDLAFAAWHWVPLHHPSLREPGWTEPPDVARRLRILLDAYGLDAGARAGLLAAIPERMQASVDRIEAGAGAGDPGLRALRDRGYLDDMRRSVDHARGLLPSLRAALT